MPCCGKNIVQTGINIVKGFSALAVGKKYEFTDARLRLCRNCEKGSLKKSRIWRLFCSECKCFIAAAARAKDKQCPLGKWAALDKKEFKDEKTTL